MFSGRLPLRGSIPDMTSDSERYIQLQNIYKTQADTDIDTVTAYVNEHLHSVGKVGYFLLKIDGNTALVLYVGHC